MSSGMTFTYANSNEQIINHINRHSDDGNYTIDKILGDFLKLYMYSVLSANILWFFHHAVTFLNRAGIL